MRAIVLAAGAALLFSACADQERPTENAGPSYAVSGSTAYPLVEIQPGNDSLAIGASRQLRAKLTDPAGKTWMACCVTWQSSDTKIATVTSRGIVKRLKAGAVTVTATTESKTTGSITFGGAATGEALSVTNLSRTNYKVVANGLKVGATQYIDRAYKFATVPASVAGLTLIQTANADKDASPGATSLLTFDVNQEVTVYVLHDDLVARPAWLANGFTDTDLDVASDVAKHSVFKRTFPAGKVTLGSNVVKASGDNMYSVAIAPTGTGTPPADGGAGAPTVSITAPANGATISGTVAITASASDADGIAGVRFRADGKDLGAEDTSAPYSYSWNTTGVPDGTYTLAAIARDKAGNTQAASATVTVKNGGGDSPATPRKGFYVSPTGSSSGDGSASRPWNLATALAHPSTVKGGDTLWLKGGTYKGAFTSRLTGSSSAPVVLRQYPGERAIIDGTLYVSGANATYWGFEVMSSVSAPQDKMSIDVHAPGTKFINLVLHDAGGNGIGMWQESSNSEIYGSIIYNNGRQRVVSGFAHGIYAQNTSGMQRFVDNVLFNQFGYGIHIYGESTALRGFHVEGNASFENGAPASSHGSVNILVGGSQPASGITLTNNYTYSTGGSTNVWLGYNARNQDITVKGNHFVGGSPALRVREWSSFNFTGNLLASANQVAVLEGSGGYSWSGNTHYRDASASAWSAGGGAMNFANWKSRTGFSDSHGGTLPSGSKVVVRPNKYEAGRANVIIYNWSGAGAVSADLSGVLKSGDRYAIRPVQNLFGSPVVSGTYSGGSVSIPMGPYAAPRPVSGFLNTPKAMGSQFNVFLVTKE